jgi:hypothetical protein
LAEQGGKISDGPQIGLNDAALSIHSGFLDLRVGERLRLDRELVGKAPALACRRTSSAAGATRRSCLLSARTSAAVVG